MYHRLGCSFSASLLVLFILAPIVGGQEADQDRIPRFRGGVRLLLVDVIVTDQDGRFVSDLNVEDFELYESGKPRDITAFSLIELPEPARRSKSGADVAPLSEDYAVATNDATASGRLFVLVLDDLHVDARRSGRVRELARGFLERSLGPHDLVSVSFTSGLYRPFTMNRAALVATVNRFMGRMLRSSTLERLDAQSQSGLPGGSIENYVTPPAERERGRRNLDTLKFLGAQCAFLETVRGRRKALVWISEGLDYDAENFNGRPYSESIRRELASVLDRAARANVAIYALNPGGLSSVADDLIQIASGPAGVPTVGVNDSVYAPGAAFAAEDAMLGTASLLSDRATALRNLRRLSELTGGMTLTNNDLEAGLDRIVSDTSRYYLLGFSPETEREPGEFQRIEVRVKRDGVDVRTRHGYSTAPDASPKTVSVWGSTASAPELQEALAQPVPVTGLALRVAAAPMGQDGETALVPVVVSSDVTAFHFDERDGKIYDDVEVWIGAFRYDGELADSVTSRVALALPAGARNQLTRDGFRAMGKLRLEPGSYQLRVALYESGADRTGSVLVDLEVPALKAGLLRGMALSSVMESRIPVAGYNRVDAVLPMPPVTTRTFDRADELILYVELINPDEKDFNLVMDMRTVDGRPVMYVEDKAPSSDGEPVLLVSRRVALSDLESGEYQVTFRAIDLDGDELAVRQTRFRVR